jgi:uncharacterized cupredoxin-like copper-binding protein
MRATLRLVSTVSALALVVACGGGSGSSARPSAAASGGAGTTITAQEKEFSIALGQATAPSGSVTFNVTHAGTVVHEFVVVDTDTGAAQLPQASGEVDESALTVVDEVEDLQPGTTETLQVDLDPGHYVVICNIPGHYAGGMHADLTVQ